MHMTGKFKEDCEGKGEGRRERVMGEKGYFRLNCLHIHAPGAEFACATSRMLVAVPRQSLVALASKS